MTGYTKFGKDGYQHRRHNKNLLMVHLIFVTKYRKSLLTGDLRIDIKNILLETSAKHHWYIKRMETDKDHIHILLQYNPTDSIARIVGPLKQVSTYQMWIKHANTLKRYYRRKRTPWSDGYFACSVGNVSKDIVERYIETQG